MRDPVRFAIDLPNPVLSWGLRFWIVVALILLDLLDVRSWAAIVRWRIGGAALRFDPALDLWRMVSPAGRPIDVWPQRLRLRADRPAILSVFGGKAEATFTRALLLDPGLSAEVTAGGPIVFKVVSLSGDEATPTVQAGTHTGSLLAGLSEGLSFADALTRAWPVRPRDATVISDTAYRRWIEAFEPAILAALPTANDARVSVIMPVHNPSPAHLAAACRSILDQAGVGVELCLCDDGSNDPAVRAVLDNLSGHSAVRLVQRPQAGGVVAATNAALALADADLVAFVDHDDLLAPGALAAMAAVFADPAVQTVYSDEDTIDDRGRRSKPVFKTAFDAERLRGHNYVNHLLMVRRQAVLDLGGVRSGTDGVQDHDLILRLADRYGAGAIRHLPAILYHWRSFPGGRSFSQSRRRHIEQARLAIVADHLSRQADRGEPRLDVDGRVMVTRGDAELPSVTVIIPTADQPELITACVASLTALTDYPRISITVIDNGRTGRSREALARIAQRPDVDVTARPGPFNHSALNNEAVASALTDVVVLMNDDVFTIEPGWLRVMALEAMRPDVGAVGAKLIYPDGRLQHGGVVVGLGRDRVAGHEMRGAPGHAEGLQGRLRVQRRADAVTAACLAIERRKFLQIGGFDADAFPIAFNDVDLCLRLEAAGFRTIWTPHSTLIHAESVSRGRADNPAAVAAFQQDVARMRTRWGARLDDGRDFHPALDRDDELTALAARANGYTARPR